MSRASSSGTSKADSAAVAEDRITSKNEAAMRKLVGVCLFIAALALFHFSTRGTESSPWHFPYSLAPCAWSLLFSVGLGVYGTGHISV